jgi:8-oxo-dGTP pyrophosphatase MutT (NUDIX family)
MKKKIIRPIAICVCRHGDRILVAEAHDTVKGRMFYRPLGGTIEFGERGEDAVRREFREELGADLLEVRYLGMLENIFTYEGLPGHEIVLVYDGLLCDPALYDKGHLAGDEMGTPFEAVCKRLEEFGPGKPPVYPEGLLEMLAL